ncbi:MULTISPECIES: hypothetical protein [Streptomyces]|uniref:Uncharacterized protein n=1 Tax=Streptomyces dengpaensis TaxID=2049881 RepID=A0ABN5HW04_9ACTN|nr:MULTISPECIES: hypothetical protein [Streptomyces]AVH55324.1 hypothetical protein C4B68_05445 [Streptomyces dengpaensis]PIB06968.1 hypothetical protein B1C81_21595 [Streptomyces sp. HG99]
MKLGDAVTPPAGLGSGRRFFMVGYLPTYAALLFVLLLFWAGARAWVEPPQGGLSFGRAWQTAAALGVGEVVFLVLAITLTAVLLNPFQTAMVRLLEGYGPAWPGSGRARERQRARKKKWQDRATLAQGNPAALTEPVVQEAGFAGSELRRRYPLPDHLVRPTALGNALAAADDGVGRAFGFDAVVAWPRLYPLLGDETRAIVDDRRDAVDGAVRMAVTMAVTAVVSAVVLVRCGGWLALALIPLVLSWIAYRGAVQAALAYGDSLHAAFDLHRFALLTALGTKLPNDPAEERMVAAWWCDLWRQGIPLPPAFRYTVEETGQGEQP